MPTSSFKKAKAPKNLSRQRLNVQGNQTIKFVKVGDKIVEKKSKATHQIRETALDVFRDQQLKDYKDYQKKCNDIIQENMKKIHDANAKIFADDDGYENDKEQDLVEAKESLSNAVENKQHNSELGELRHLQIENQLMTEATAIPEFNELVREHIERDQHNSSSKEHACKKCPVQFMQKWELDRHEGQAHKQEASRLLLACNGKYHCRICGSNEASLYELKVHVFRLHSEIDLRAVYAVSIEKFVGSYEANRLRQSLFSKIEKDKFNHYIQDTLRQKDYFKIDTINCTFPISVDPDHTNAERRRIYYGKKRDFCLKLAKLTDEKLDEFEPFSREMIPADGNLLVNFDLKKDFYNEQIPDLAVKCLRYTRLWARDDLKFLPKFLGFNRHGMLAQLKLSKYPLVLREIIGDRNLMLKLGPQVITQLLTSYLYLKRRQVVLQSIQPSTIFLSGDINDLVYGDILSISQEGQNQKASNLLHPPYACNQSQYARTRSQALEEYDQFSIGMIFLEILIGTELVINATNEELQNKLVVDCCCYFDQATTSLLRYLIFDEEYVDVETYVQHFIGGERDVVRGCILKFQAALIEDGDLQKWQKSGQSYLNQHSEAAYKKYRVRASDIKENLDWSCLAEECELPVMDQ